MATQDIKLHPSWREPLRGEFDQPYMAELKRFLVELAPQLLPQVWMKLDVQGRHRRPV